MKGLFQCPPWARSFCPFRACWIISTVQEVYWVIKSHSSNAMKGQKTI